MKRLTRKLLNAGKLGNQGTLADARRHDHLVKVHDLARLIQRDGPLVPVLGARHAADGGAEAEAGAEVEIVGVVF